MSEPDRRAVSAARDLLRHELSIQEIAERLGVSRTTVRYDLKHRLSRIHPELARRVEARLQQASPREATGALTRAGVGLGLVEKWCRGEGREHRAVKLAMFVLEHGASIRQTAQHFNVSKSTVHRDLREHLPQIDPDLARQVNEVLTV